MNNLNKKKKNAINGTIKINLPVLITAEDIDDIMVGAMEGGITYWCSRVDVEGEYLGEYASEQISRGGILHFYPDEPISDDDPEYFTLDYQKIIDGIAMWLDSLEPEAYGRVIEVNDNNSFHLSMGNIDALDCDSIIQYALFGEEAFA